MRAEITASSEPAEPEGAPSAIALATELGMTPLLPAADERRWSG